jgi:hypothetical protein
MPVPMILDENARDHRLWHAIQSHNLNQTDLPLDIVRVGDPGCPRLGTSDADLMTYSIQSSRSIVTLDANTLIGHHQEIVKSGVVTPGLFIISRNQAYNVIVFDLAIAANLLRNYEYQNTCKYIPLRS